jgi:hypothetical protein
MSIDKSDPTFSQDEEWETSSVAAEIRERTVRWRGVGGKKGVKKRVRWRGVGGTKKVKKRVRWRGVGGRKGCKREI